MKKKKKKVNKKSPERFQKHFRKFHSKETTGHPSYVYGEKGKNYKVIGITSASKTNDIDNIPLLKNPEPKNTSPAYIRPKPIEVDKGIKNRRLKGWKFTDADKKKVQAIIDKDKK